MELQSLMHQVHGKVSRVSLNVYPMWLIFTCTRPQERYGRISQYKKLIQSFPIIFFVTKLVLLPSISIVDFFCFCTRIVRKI
jgi:hypothetical protein